MGDQSDTTGSFNRPSGTPEHGAGGVRRNDLTSAHFGEVKNAAINLSRGYLTEDQDLLPRGGMRVIYPKSWRDVEGLRVHSRYGRPVIFEYKNGKMVFKTTNPSKAEVAYMEGDIFFVKSLRKRDVESIYPALKSSTSGFSYLGLLLLFVGFEEPKYTVGQQILKIDLLTKRVQTKAVIKLGGQWIPIEGHNSYNAYSEQNLNISWYHYIVSSDLVRFGGWVEFVTLNVATFGAAGIGRKVGKKIAQYVGKKAARKGFRRIFSELLQKILRTSLKCSTKFMIALAKDIEAKNSLAEMEKRAGIFSGNMLAVSNSFIATSSEFSNCLVETMFDSVATKYIPGFVSDLTGEGAGIIKKKITGAITTELIKLPTSAFFGKMNTAITKAIADSRAGKGSFSELMPKYLLEEFQSHISGMAKSWSSGIADTLTENWG